MPEHLCKTCEYKTNRKSNYINHINSKAHKNAVVKIEEEKEFYNEEEKTQNELLKKQIELLELQLKIKEITAEKAVEELEEVQIKKFSFREYINSLKDVMNITSFMEKRYELATDFCYKVNDECFLEKSMAKKFSDSVAAAEGPLSLNKQYILTVHGFNAELKEKSNTIYSNIFKNVLFSVPKLQRPFYCADKRRKKIYFYNEFNEWELILAEDKGKKMIWIANWFINLLTNALINLNRVHSTLLTKDLYELNKESYINVLSKLHEKRDIKKIAQNIENIIIQYCCRPDEEEDP